MVKICKDGVDMINILVVCDLGYANPYWNDFCSNMVNEGCNVTVLTPKMSKFQKKFFGIPKFPNYNLLQTKKFKMFYRKVDSYPKIFRVISLIFFRFFPKNQLNLEDHSAWIQPAILEATKYAASHKIDIVISTSLPIECHVIGSSIKKLIKVPWIADYRDPYSFNHNSLTRPSKEIIAWEQNLLAVADLVTTTSYGFAKSIKKVYGGDIQIIENGYSRIFHKHNSFKLPLRIVYPGQIYKNFQNPRIVLDALEAINHSIESQPKIVITFSGVSTGVITSFYREQKKAIPDWVKLEKQYSLKKSLELQRNSDLLLLLNWEDHRQKGVMQTKLYEYIASGTPILATGGNGKDETAEVLRLSRTAVNIANSKDVFEFFQQILESKNITYERDLEYVETLSRKSQVKKLLKFVNKLLIQIE